MVHYIWDPAGVSDIPQEIDEYHVYITTIYDRVQAGDLKELVDYLKWVVFENMGLKIEKETVVEAAKIMLDWKESTDDSP